MINIAETRSIRKRVKIPGTQEWAVKTVNCCTGCSHDCRYCYAKNIAVRFRRVKREEWKNEQIRWRDVFKNYRKIDGTIMFPSSHDITPNNVFACLEVLQSLLEVGNRVLIVSKPHRECIVRLCDRFSEFKDQILFRFTIGAYDDEILRFWEPGAPGYEERKSSLKYAFDEGFETSLSIEPMLDSENIEDLVYDLMPYVTDAIWIGTMNYLHNVVVDDERVEQELNRIRNGQTDERIWEIYRALRGHDKIKWKSHIKKIVGIPLAKKNGMDV